MNSLIVAVLSFFGYIIAYRFYGRFLAGKIFRLDDNNVTPSHRYRDNTDYVPTHK